MTKIKNKALLIGIVLIGILSVLSFQPAGAADFPVELGDDLGGTIRMDKKPERIISMAPSITEMLYSFGLGDRIVGVSTYANYPKKATEKEKIGNVTDPNVEKIVSLKPDLVLAAAVNKMEYIDKLKSLGIPVAGFAPSSISETISVMNKVGRLTGEQFIAKKLTEKMVEQVAEIEELVAEKLKDNKRPGVFYEIWHDPLMTAGKGTFIDNLIKIAGGRNIGGLAKGSWPQYSLEKLLLENPEVYISSHHSDAHTFTVEGLKERPNYSTLKSVQNDRIHFIKQDVMTRPSPRIIIGLKELAKTIWPDLEDEIDRI